MKILVPLAEGLEEIEAVTVIDMLRRVDIEIITASLSNKNIVTGSHKIKMKSDKLINELESDNFDGIYLPGGMPGADNLKNNNKVIEFIKYFNQNKKLIAAICAAPIVLEKAGVIKNKNATSYPGFYKKMPSCNYQEKSVVIDENIITGRGPGVALNMGLVLVEYLLGKEESLELKKSMLIN